LKKKLIGPAEAKVKELEMITAMRRPARAFPDYFSRLLIEGISQTRSHKGQCVNCLLLGRSQRLRGRLTSREIFEAGIAFLALKNVLFALFDSAPAVSVAARGMPPAA
jgi:hypothetical protein